MLRIGVVGCGTGGPAAALLLHAQGHQVEVLEAVPDPVPVGAGILLQPTGMGVLSRLRLLDDVLAQGARIERLDGVTAGGRRVLDLSYADLAPGLFGLGLHRGALFGALFGELRRRGVPVRCDAAIRAIEPCAQGTVLRDSAGAQHGPYDLVIAADGARSRVRGEAGPPGRVDRYPWGALWAILEDAPGDFDGVLAQVYRGTHEMLGFLPVGRPSAVAGGRPLVSLFWSVRLAGHDQWRARGLDAWKAAVLALSARAAPLLEQIRSPDDLLLAAYHDVRLPRWHADGLVLIGDAGHAMSPQLGQGVNLALLDAEVLAQCVGAGREPLPAALARYSVLRRRHLRFYATASRWLTPAFQSSHGWLAPPRDALTQPLSRVPWIRRQMLASLAGVKTGVLGSMSLDGP